MLLLGRQCPGEHVGHQRAVRAVSRGLEAAGGIIAGQIDVGGVGARRSPARCRRYRLR